MNSPTLRFASGLLLIVFVLIQVAVVRADVGPPIKIGMVLPARPATSGQTYAGTFEVQVGGAGQIEALSLEGDGWTVVSWDPPLKRPLKAGDVLKIPFRALPADASKPLHVRLTFNGRTIGKTLDFSPQYFARAGKPRATRSMQGIRSSPQLGPIVAADWPHTIHFQGRIVYTRIGRDTSTPPDGIDDIPAQIVGVDGIPFEIMDLDDDIYDEEMYSGHTDQDGYFDVTLDWNDCDLIGCDDPDIYIRWECDTGIVNVQSAGIIEEDYSWSTKDTGLISNFTGSEVDFGELSPTDPDDHPALHIFNSITRAHRFIQTRVGLDVPEVDVQWPEDGTTSYYDPFFEEIHITGTQQWQESTHVHEYGHHFLESFTSTIAADYCNGFCDDDPSWPFPDCGHCVWCPETGHDAWNEGWPNWLSDIFTRSHQADYGYPTLFTSNQERTRICDQDNDGIADPNSYDPLKTEGHIGALLRDIEDDMEDQNNDGVPDVQPFCARDALSLGVEEIFTVVTLDQPQRPSEFIDAFRARYPQYANVLWQTANNVAPEYTWADVAQPEAVSDVTSPTHPVGTGGSSPFIHVQWTTPGDDASGVDGYSFVWSQAPETVPDSTAELEGSESATTSPPLALGSWYFGIRTRDCAGRWDDDFTVFGPFEVTECNGNGIVDLCDTGCQFADGFCNVPGCGTAPDCNINGVPDTCDLAGGTSHDCNLNGRPDECDPDSFVSWIGQDGLWHQTQNWDAGHLPGAGDYVCIDVPTVSTVTYSQGSAQIAGLRSHERFVLSGGSLTLAQRSIMHSNLSIALNFFPEYEARLDGNGDLTVEGLLTLSQATLAGGGLIVAQGGLLIDSTSTNATVLMRNSRAVNNIETASFRGTAPWIRMQDTAVFYNQGTFECSGGGSIEAYSGTPRFANQGRFEKSGSANLDVSAAFDNTGEVHVLGGKLILRGGSQYVNSGSYTGAPGTVIEFGAGTCQLGPASSVGAYDVQVTRSANVTVNGSYDLSGTTTLVGGTITFTPAGNLISLGQTLKILTNEVTANFNCDEPITLANYIQNEGWVYFNTGQPVSITNYTQTRGQLTGTDNLLVSGPLLWSGGSIQGTGQTYANGGMTINGGVLLANSRTLNNPQTTTFTGAAAGLSMTGTSKFNNSGTFNAESNGAISQYGAGHFNNTGQFNKLGPGTMPISVIFDNTGAVNVLAGTLELDGGSSITNTGSFNGNPDTVLQFNHYSYTLGNTSSISIGHVGFSWGSVVTMDGSYQATGSTTMGGNTLTFTAAGTLLGLGDTLTISGGTTNFNNDEPISVNTFNLSGGTGDFSTGRSVTVNTLNQSGGFLVGSDTLTVTGPATWSSGYMQGGGQTHTDGGLNITGYVVLRESSGSRTLRTSQTTSFSGAARVVMAGTSAIINQGTFDALSDGPIERSSGTPSFTNNGTFNKLGPGTLPFSVACTNTGRLDVQAGLLQFSRAYTQTTGATVLNGGNIQSALTLDIQGGQLAGTGTITANVASGGTVSPGTSMGILNLSGNYTQNTTGELDIEIGGPDPATQFDQLKVTGSATLAGKLRLTLVNGYSPAPGTSFTVMIFASRSGELTEIVGPASRRFAVAHNANNITLSAVPTASADFDGDGDVDGDDYDVFESCGSGPGIPYADGCGKADFDSDNDVDQSDFAVFQRCLGGEGNPADPGCTG